MVPRFARSRSARLRTQTRRRLLSERRRVAGTSGTTSRFIQFARPGFRHQKPNQRKAGERDNGQAPESRSEAEAIGHITRQGRAQRRAYSGGGAENALAKVETAGAAGEVGDHKRTMTANTEAV